MKDVLTSAVEHAITKGSLPETWQNPMYQIPAPKYGDFEEIAESVGKIPLVGKGLASAVMAPMDDIMKSFADCGQTVFSSAALSSGLKTIVDSIDGATAIALGQEGGFAYSQYMMNQSQETLSTVTDGVVQEVLKTHPITTVWGTCITAYNAAASKIPGVDILEFDLSDYVVAQIMATLGSLIFEKESTVRSGNVEGMSESVKKIYGKAQISVAEQIKPIILVKKGDARTICFQKPFPEAVDSKTLLDPTNAKGVQMISKGGLVIVQKWTQSMPVGKGGLAYWNQIGMGQPEQIAEDGKVCFFVFNDLVCLMKMCCYI